MLDNRKFINITRTFFSYSLIMLQLATILPNFFYVNTYNKVISSKIKNISSQTIILFFFYVQPS